MRILLALGLVVAQSAPAIADDEVCVPGARYRGAKIDLDVRRADIQDVLRLLADAGHANLVVADEVRGTVTVKLARVPWDQAVCVVAQLQELRITRNGSVLTVTPRGAK